MYMEMVDFFLKNLVKALFYDKNMILNVSYQRVFTADDISNTGF